MSSEQAFRLSKGSLLGIAVTAITVYEVLYAKYIISKYDAKIVDVNSKHVNLARRDIMYAGKTSEDAAKKMVTDIAELRHKMQSELPLPWKLKDKVSEIMTFGKGGFSYRALKYGKKLSDTDIVFSLSKAGGETLQQINGLKKKYDDIMRDTVSRQHLSSYSTSDNYGSYYSYADNSVSFWDFSTTNNYYGSDGHNNYSNDDEDNGSGAAILFVIAGIATVLLVLYRGINEFFTSKEVSRNYGQDLYALFEKYRSEAKTAHAKGAEINKDSAIKVCEEKEDIKYKHQAETPFFARIGAAISGKFKSTDCKKLVEEKGAEKAFYSAFKSPDGRFYGNQLPEIMHISKILTDNWKNVYPEDIDSSNVQCIINACESRGHTLLSLGCVLETLDHCGIGRG